MLSFIRVRHNIEVAHRLMNLPGKCQQIHGHSMSVEMHLEGDLNTNGILEGLDFSAVKKRFRNYLDEVFDHHLILNVDDPWAQSLFGAPRDAHSSDYEPLHELPGLVTVPGDPTVENLAKWIAEWCNKEFKLLGTMVYIEETRTNGAGYVSFDEDPDND